MGIHFQTGTVALGLDPGRDKTGFAFIDFETGKLLTSGIFDTYERENFFSALQGQAAFSYQWLREGELPMRDLAKNLKFIAIGNGTTGNDLLNYAEQVLSCHVLSIDEKGTTLEARELYWNLHKPALLQRILPRSLRVPQRVLDDLAAFAIALRGVKIYRDIVEYKL